MWRVILALCLTTAGFAAGWYVAADHFGRKAAELAAAQSNAIVGAQELTVQRLKLTEQVSLEVGSEYVESARAISLRYRDFAERMLQYKIHGCVSGTVSDPACFNLRGTEADRLSEGAREHLIQLMEDADVQTARLLACQRWVRKQYAASH